MHMSSLNSTNASLLTFLGSSSSDTSGTGAAASTTTTAANAAATKAASKAALETAAKGFRAAASEQTLEKQQAALGTDLQAALKKTGVKLAGSVDFSLGTDGKLAMHGSDADKAAATAFLKADGSNPSFSSRLTSLAQAADKLSGGIRQSAAISQAARYGGQGAGVVSLYTSLMQSQDTTPALFSLSASASSLSYPGVLAVKA
jgi:hypothetical protein